MKPFSKHALRKYPAAFHEIIKLNGAVKQHCELLLKSFPNDRNALAIFQSSELMSRQFEIAELIANQELTSLPLKARSAFNQLVFKVLKIFEHKAQARNIKIERNLVECSVLVCDKTIPIIPTVLIDNAIRYSQEGSVIRVGVVAEHGYCTFSVVNHSQQEVDQESLFKKGYRANSAVEGSGYGLFVAQLIAKQHQTQIMAAQQKDTVTFSVKFKLA